MNTDKNVFFCLSVFIGVHPWLNLFFLGLALAVDVEFHALRNVPLPFTPDCRREWSLAVLILSQVDGVRTQGTTVPPPDGRDSAARLRRSPPGGGSASTAWRISRAAPRETG